MESTIIKLLQATLSSIAKGVHIVPNILFSNNKWQFKRATEKTLKGKALENCFETIQ